ncbi:MAG: adenylate/guanylate cyclase domain-containing protein [Candidatus Riflebacteria bacterium]
MKLFVKHGVSLRITLFTAFLGTVLFTTFLNAGISSLHVKNLILESVREKLQVAVGIGAQQIDGDIHAKIMRDSDKKSVEFKTIFDQLSKILTVNPDIKNVYTLRQTATNEAVFVVDADPKEKERANVGHRVILITPSMAKAFAEKNLVVVERKFYKDEWGTFVSGFAPFFKSDGTFEGLLGMDVMAETVRSHQINNILAILTTCIVVTFVAVFLSLIISRKISDPITRVTTDMAEIQKFNLESALESCSKIHEIRRMTDALDNMKKGLRSFKKYVPTELVSDLIKLKKEASLEAENRQITILFSDIQGFTSISEKIAPDDLAESIGFYFGEMTQIIMDTGGIVDKYIGDAIMALWGTPHDLEDHQLSACCAALRCREKEKEINEWLQQKGLPTFFTRIGINSGPAIVGNFGFDKRMTYTAIGDSVNLASRLEGINKFYQTAILISQYTYNAVKNHVLARLVDVVIVKGKTEGVRIYELISLLANADEKEIKRVSRHNKAMNLYLNKNWRSALRLFKALKKQRDDFTVGVMIERCQNFIENPPGDDFVGVVALRNK